MAAGQPHLGAPATLAVNPGLRNVHPHTLRHSCGVYLADGFYLADKDTDLRIMQETLANSPSNLRPEKRV